MKARREEQGAALLTVLMLVAVISVLAMAALERLKLATHLAGNAAAMNQARLYAMAGEQIVISRLTLLNDENADRTFLAGGRTFPVPLDVGKGAARLSDGGNCFNLNSVVEGSAAIGNLTMRPTGVAQFSDLLTALEVPPATASSLANSLTDWIDSDSQPLPGGAEDDVYLRGPKPHRTANSLIHDPGEIRTLAGMTPALYDRIRPWVCALPTTDLSPIGVNTLTPDQAPLVAMLIPGQIGLGAARAMIDSRPRGGFADVNRFWAQPALAGTTPAPDVLAQVQLKPRWVALRLTIGIGEMELEEQALIDTATQPAKLVQRRYGGAL